MQQSQPLISFLIVTILVLLAIILLLIFSRQRWNPIGSHERELPFRSDDGQAEMTSKDSPSVSKLGIRDSLKTLFCDAGDATLLTDANGIITSAQGRLFAELGIPPEQLLGENQIALLDFPSRRNLLQSSINRARSREKYSFEMSFQLDSKSTPRWLSVFGGRVRDEVGNDLYLTVLRDIHETVLARRHSQKLSQLGKMYGVCEGLAKGYNNWIREINLYANMIDDDSVRMCIREANGRATNLTKSLLKFSPRHSDSDRVLNLSEFVKTLTPLITKKLPHQIQFNVDSQINRGVRVKIDPGDLQQIFINIIENSISSIADTGSILVTLTTQDFALKEARLRSLPAGQYVSISFGDDGTGMSQDVVERAFEPCFTTRHQLCGAGMGLPTTHHLIVKAGGRIDLESSPSGTIVTVLLPLNVEDAAPSFVPALEGTFQEKPKVSGEHILLIEDQAVLRKAIHSAMSEAGFFVESFATAEEAWEAMLNAKTVDCVVSDIVLTGMSGVQLYEKIRERDTQQKVILISGYRPGRFVDEAKFENDSYVRFVQKPFLINKLIATLDDIKERSSHVTN